MKKQSGATILEVLIAFTLLAFGIMTLLEFQNDAFRTASITQQQNQALVLAEEKLNELKHFVELDSTPSVSDYEDIVNGTDSATGNNTNYTVTWRVTENTTPNYKVVNVTVSWTDQANEAQSVSLESIVGKVSVVKTGEYMQSL